MLSDRKTALRIISLIDTYDAELLTAIDILREPDPGMLFHLFRTDRDYFSFHNHLMNLNERLLIYTVPDGNILQINPYLYPVLKERVLAPRLLFPPADETPEDDTGDPVPKPGLPKKRQGASTKLPRPIRRSGKRRASASTILPES